MTLFILVKHPLLWDTLIQAVTSIANGLVPQQPVNCVDSMHEDLA